VAVSDDLLVKVSIDTGGGSAAVKDLSVSLSDLKKSAEDGGDAVLASGMSFSKAAVSAIALNQAVDLAVKAYDTLAEPIKESIAAFVESEKAQTTLINTLKAVGITATAAFDDLDRFAKGLQDTTTTSDEAVLSLASMAKVMGLSNKQTKELIKASLDVASVTGNDVSSAFNELIGQYSGVSGRQAKYVVGLKDLTEAQLKAGEGIKLVAKQYGGFAEVQAKTLAGAMQQSKTAFEDVYEEIGSVISKLFNLPASALAAKERFISLAAAVKSFGATLLEIKTVLSGIDWASIAQSVLTVGTAFAAFGLAAFAVQATAAISAIGGLSAAIAAMGGMTGIMAQLFAFFKGPAILAAAKSIGSLALSFGAWAAAIIIVGGGIDILVRNMDHLGELGTVVAGAFTVLFERLKRGFDGLRLIILQSISAPLQAIAGTFLDVGGVASKTLDNITASQLKFADSIDVSNKEIENQQAALKEVSKGIDFGFIGQGIELVNGLLADTKTKAEDVKKTFDDTSRINKENLKPTKEQLQLLAQIKLENIGIANETASIGASQFEILAKTLELELQKIDARKQQLTIEGKINKEIAAQLDKQAALVTEKSKKQVDQIGKADIIPQSTVDALRGSIGDGAADFAGGISSGFASFAGGVGAIMGATNAVLGFAQQVLDFIPGVINKIAGLFDSLTSLPTKIGEAALKLFSSVISFVKDFIPNLFKFVDTLLTGIADFIINLPDAFVSLIDGFPALVTKLIGRIPEIVSKFTTGFITGGPKIVAALIKATIEGTPAIWRAVIDLVTTTLPAAVLDAFVQAFYEVKKLFLGLVKQIGSILKGTKIPTPAFVKDIADLPKALGKGIGALSKGVAKEASKVFKVLDLENAAAAVDRLKSAAPVVDIVTKAADAVGKSTKSVWLDILSAFKKVWAEVVRFLSLFGGTLKAVWEGVMRLLNMFISALSAVWDGIVKALSGYLKILQAVWNGLIAQLTAAWNGLVMVLTAAWNGLMSILTAVWDGLMSYLTAVWDSVQLIWNTLMDLFQGKIGIFEAVTKMLGSIFDTAKAGLEAVAHIFGAYFNSLKGIFDAAVSSIAGAFSAFTDSAKNIGGAIWEGLKGGLSGIGDILKNAINAIDPGNLLAKIFKMPAEDKGPVEKTLGIDIPWAHFAQGGIIPGTSSLPGDSLANDRVIAMVSPGEAVLPRSVTGDPKLAPYVDALLSGNADKVLPAFFSLKAPKNIAVNAGPAIAGLTAGLPKIPGLSDVAQHALNTAQSEGAKAAEMLSKLDPSKLWDIVKVKAWDGIQAWWDSAAVRMHTGGMVPNFAGGGEVPAILQPGEFVMQRGAVNRLGAGMLGGLNNGGSGGGGSTVVNMDVSVSINASSQSLDETYVRSKLIPSIKSELKKASLRGDFLMSERGLRAT